MSTPQQHHRHRNTRYHIRVFLADHTGLQQGLFDLERTGADAVGTLVSHHCWAASQSRLRISIYITDEPAPPVEPHTTGNLPAL